MPKRTWRGHSKRPVILPELTSSSWHSSNRYGGASVPDAKIEKNADSRVFLWREFIVKNRGNDGHNNIAKRQRRRVVVAVWSWNDRVRRNASARTHTHHTCITECLERNSRTYCPTAETAQQLQFGRRLNSREITKNGANSDRVYARLYSKADGERHERNRRSTTKRLLPAQNNTLPLEFQYTLYTARK